MQLLDSEMLMRNKISASLVSYNKSNDGGQLTAHSGPGPFPQLFPPYPLGPQSALARLTEIPSKMAEVNFILTYEICDMDNGLGKT